MTKSQAIAVIIDVRHIPSLLTDKMMACDALKLLVTKKPPMLLLLLKESILLRIIVPYFIFSGLAKSEKSDFFTKVFNIWCLVFSMKITGRIK